MYSTNLYLIVGMLNDHVVFSDSFLGDDTFNGKEKRQDPEVIRMVDQYKELAEGSEPINRILLYWQAPNEEMEKIASYSIEDVDLDDD